MTQYHLFSGTVVHTNNDPEYDDEQVVVVIDTMNKRWMIKKQWIIAVCGENLTNDNPQDEPTNDLSEGPDGTSTTR